MTKQMAFAHLILQMSMFLTLGGCGSDFHAVKMNGEEYNIPLENYIGSEKGRDGEEKNLLFRLDVENSLQKQVRVLVQSGLSVCRSSINLKIMASEQCEINENSIVISQAKQFVRINGEFSTHWQYVAVSEEGNRSVVATCYELAGLNDGVCNIPFNYNDLLFTFSLKDSAFSSVKSLHGEISNTFSNWKI